MLHFLRTYSDCILTTGSILRKEPGAYEPSLVEQMGFDLQVFFDKPKPLAIMTNQLSENLIETHKAYTDLRYRKHVLSSDTIVDSFLRQFPGINEQFKQRANTTVEGVQGLNLRTAIDYVQS